MEKKYLVHRCKKLGERELRDNCSLDRYWNGCERETEVEIGREGGGGEKLIERENCGLWGDSLSQQRGEERKVSSIVHMLTSN